MSTTKKPVKDRAIPFVNRHGHTMRLSGSMKLSELFKMGFVRVSIVKPGTTMLEGEWKAVDLPK